MKTLITASMIAAVIGTPIMASQVDHELQTGKLSASCAFSAPINGVMTYNEASNRFVSVAPSTITIDQKRMDRVVVTTTGAIDGIFGAIASIDWSTNASTLDGVTMSTEGDGMGISGYFSKNNQKGLVLSIEPASFAVDPDVFTPASNATYVVTWEATCFE